MHRAAVIVALLVSTASAGRGIPDRQSPRSGNPILSGWYADPEARIFEHEYWIYPTYSAPYDEQTFLDAFSSTDIIGCRHRLPATRRHAEE